MLIIVFIMGVLFIKDGNEYFIKNLKNLVLEFDF